MSREYYQQSADWAYDMYQSQSVWLRRALAVLVSLISLLALSLCVNLYMLPLKEKVPYLYAFDHATGEITKVGELEQTTLSGNWALTRYFIIHYVMNYEGYNFDNINLPYQLVWAQSSEHVRSQYEAYVKSDNAHSPYQQFGKNQYVTVRVISVNRLNDSTVDVKFEKTLHDRSASTEHVIQKEAIIKWAFQQAETSQKMLERDPLGFKVTYYQATQINLDNNKGV